MKTTQKNAWPHLNDGDLIDVILPGFPCSPEAILGAKNFIESLGYQARIPNDLLGKDLISSNSQSVRLKHLRKALTDPKSKMIWCLRGGYGSIQLLPELQKIKKPKTPKLFWGYSDASTLHLFLSEKWAWPCIHGPLLDRLGTQSRDVSVDINIKNILSGESQWLEYQGLIPMNSAAKSKKKITGSLVGGNMTVLTSSVGTPWAMKTKGKILFLEDTGERAYRIDRMLQQLHQSKSFDGLKAIVLGDFLGGPDKDGVSRVWDLWQQYAKSVKIPVFSGVPAGHGDLQMPLALNTKAELQLGSEGILRCHTGVKV